MGYIPDPSSELEEPANFLNLVMRISYVIGHNLLSPFFRAYMAYLVLLMVFQSVGKILGIMEWIVRWIAGRVYRGVENGGSTRNQGQWRIVLVYDTASLIARFLAYVLFWSTLVDILWDLLKYIHVLGSDRELSQYCLVALSWLSRGVGL